MANFDDDFFNNFDANFGKVTKRAGWAVFLLGLLNFVLVAGTLSFLGWIAYVLLVHFGIV